MAEILEQQAILKGGEFLISETHPEDIFIPEEMDEEQQMIRQTCDEFVYNDIYTNMDKIEKQENNIASDLLKKAGDLGLLASHMPEEYGGMNLDTNTNTLICEALGKSGSFSVTYAAHTGIGMLPILYFGTEKQKEQYLPKLSTGELQACYCLTEPGAGSDALASKTTAVLTEDGKHYLLSGQKMWISNSGFADVFIVFAKIDGEHFTGFIVDKNTDGLTLGAEEAKLGLKGSSTRQVFFENAKIPAENILGEKGKGHLIAFNVLNVGRFKLGALSLGAAKESIKSAATYANERVQFGVAIATFGAIKYKLAEQTIRNYALESAQYRASQMIQGQITALQADGMEREKAKLEAAEEYAIECAILKVLGSEVLDYTVDETVQIFGGLGFSEEYSAARAYRDSRVNRIYEGTNEINRLIAVNQLMKRAMKGQIDITNPARAVQKELVSGEKGEVFTGDCANEKNVIAGLKKVFLMVTGAAFKSQMDGKVNLKHEQEILMNISDMMIEIFAAESTLLRVAKLKDMGRNVTIEEAALKVVMTDTTDRIAKIAKDALTSFAEGDELTLMLKGVRKFAQYAPINVKAARRTVADKVIKLSSYPF